MLGAQWPLGLSLGHLPLVEALAEVSEAAAANAEARAASVALLVLAASLKIWTAFASAKTTPDVGMAPARPVGEFHTSPPRKPTT